MDDLTDVEWLRSRLRIALHEADRMADDIEQQDGVRLTGTVMRLDRVAGMLDEASRTLRLIYEQAYERDQALSDRTVGAAPSGRGGVVADILGAAAARVRPDRGVVDHVRSRTADVA